MVFQKTNVGQRHFNVHEHVIWGQYLEAVILTRKLLIPEFSVGKRIEINSVFLLTSSVKKI